MKSFRHIRNLIVPSGAALLILVFGLFTAFHTFHAVGDTHHDESACSLCLASHTLHSVTLSVPPILPLPLENIEKAVVIFVSLIQISSPLRVLARGPPTL